MFRRQLFLIVASCALILGTALAAVAQSGELRGHVTMTQADGQKTPVAEAAIDVYRTDLPGKYNTKTNKKGEFVFAGLPFVGTYTVVVSHPTAAPTWSDGVRPGRGVDYAFDMRPGDGKRPTIEEIRAASAGAGGSNPGAASGGARETAEEKAKREELMRKNAEIEESNKKIVAANEVINRTFKAGNEARAAKNWDEAIRQYDEGLAADPEQLALLTNKALTLKSRGVDRYNAAIKATDDAGKTSGMAAAKADFTAAADTARKAADQLKKMGAASPGGPPDPQEQQRQAANKLATLATRAEVMRLYVTKADQTKVDEGYAAYQEYLAVETDPVRKAKGEHDLALMLFDANDFERALVQYKKILEASPDDLEALLRSGQALFNLGAMSTDGSSKAKYEEAKGYLTRYISKSTDAALKDDAKAILDTLKEEENAKPATAPGKRRGRP
jgi:tetratricopeptide (TPR) repeat protein